MADIDIEPSALTEFAQNSQIDLDVDSLQGLASTASGGQSQLPEGNELFNSQRASIQQVMSYLSQVKEGNRTYRDGADKLATQYTTTDDQLARNTQAVASAANSNGSSTSAASA